MNVEVFILFLNATLIPIISSIYVIVILRKNYIPVIKEKEKQVESTKYEKIKCKVNLDQVTPK